MKKIIIVSFFLFVSMLVRAQKNVAYVVYKSYDKAEEFFEKYHWFTPNMLIHTERDMSPLPTEYPLYVDGKWIMTTDSTLHLEQYRAYRESVRQGTHLLKQPIRYRIYNSNIHYRNSHIGKDTTHYIVVDTLQPMSEWVIQDEQLVILGFTCQKAVTNFKGTNYTAYFTTQLPFAAGPNNFRGLPGLILKVQSEKGTRGFYATEVIYPYTGEVPSIDKPGKLITQKEAVKLIEESNKQVMGSMYNVKPN